MRLSVKAASSLLICASLFVAWFASPAIAAGRGAAADFAGVWETVAESGATYRMTLRVDGTNVSGEFTNKTTALYNGTIGGVVDPSLDGTASGGKFEYYFAQPKIKASGVGYFVVGTDGRMAGFFTIDGAGAKKHAWEGTRISNSGGNDVPVTPGNTSQRTANAATTIYDKPEGNQVGYIAEGDVVTVTSCTDNGQGWCAISKPKKGFVWGGDLD